MKYISLKEAKNHTELSVTQESNSFGDQILELQMK